MQQPDQREGADRAEVLRVLVRLVDPQVLEGARRTVPLALDRPGLVLRVEYRRGHADVRLPLDPRARSFDDVRAGLRGLPQRAHEVCPDPRQGPRPYGSADLLRAGPAAARICRPEP